MCRDHGRSDIAMAEQLLYGSNVIIGLQKMAGETVAKGMGGDTSQHLLQ